MLIDQIQSFDQWLFHVIHNGWSTHVLDVIMPILRNKVFWIWWYVLVIYLAYRKMGTKNTMYFILFSVLGVVFVDYLSSSVLKPLIHRARPCQIGEALQLIVNCGTGYSFPSSHAANHFFLAGFWSFFFKNKSLSIVFYLWAFLVGFAQIYVGVHYPLDIFGGAVLGLLVAGGWALIWIRYI